MLMKPPSPLLAPVVAASLVASALPALSATLIHSWDFEGDFADDVGGANGSVTGSTTVTTGTGFNGGTATTFGSGGSTSTDHLVSLGGTVSTPITGFSITFWLNLPDDGITVAPSGADNRGFFDFSAAGTVSGAQGLYLTGSNALNFRVDNGINNNAAVFLSGSVGVEDGNWHHVALTFEPGQATGGFLAYLDGVALANTFVNNGTTLNNTSGFTSGNIDSITPYLGSYNLGSTRHGLNGALDDFQIWSGVLSDTEVAALAAVPEPGITLLGALGLLGLLRRRR